MKLPKRFFHALSGAVALIFCNISPVPAQSFQLEVEKEITPADGKTVHLSRDGSVLVVETPTGFTQIQHPFDFNRVVHPLPPETAGMSVLAVSQLGYVFLTQSFPMTQNCVLYEFHPLTGLRVLNPFAMNGGCEITRGFSNSVGQIVFMIENEAGEQRVLLWNRTRYFLVFDTATAPTDRIIDLTFNEVNGVAYSLERQGVADRGYKIFLAPNVTSDLPLSPAIPRTASLREYTVTADLLLESQDGRGYLQDGGTGKLIKLKGGATRLTDTFIVSGPRSYYSAPNADPITPECLFPPKNKIDSISILTVSPLGDVIGLLKTAPDAPASIVRLTEKPGVTAVRNYCLKGEVLKISFNKACAGLYTPATQAQTLLQTGVPTTTCNATLSLKAPKGVKFKKPPSFKVSGVLSVPAKKLDTKLRGQIVIPQDKACGFDITAPFNDVNWRPQQIKVVCE